MCIRDRLKAAPDAAVQGRIVFVSQKMTRRRDGGGYGTAVGVRAQAAEIGGRKGAVAALIRSIGTDNDRFPHTGGGVWFGQIALDAELRKRAITLSDGSLIATTLVPAAALSNPDADQLDRLVALGQPVRIKLELDVGYVGEYHGHNVIGDLIGRERPEEIVLIGGHLDSWDPGTGAEGAPETAPAVVPPAPTASSARVSAPGEHEVAQTPRNKGLRCD